jgi:hypothetical protein
MYFARQYYCNVKKRINTKKYQRTDKYKRMKSRVDIKYRSKPTVKALLKEQRKIRTLRTRDLIVKIGRRYLFQANTVEEAQRIKALIKERLSEFKQGQLARARSEGHRASQVRTEAAAGADQVGA